METIEQTFLGTLGFGNQVACKIARNGDLITNMYMKYVPNDLIDGEYIGDPQIFSHPTAFPRLGTALLKEINIEIGGQQIDKHYAHWLSVREDLFEKNDHKTIPLIVNPNSEYESHLMSEQTRPTAGVWTQSEVDAAEFTAAQLTDQYSGRLGLNHEMNSNYSNSMTHIHPATRYQQLTGNYIVSGKNAWKGLGAHDRFVPLNFWFCRNPGLALPIIALQYHEVVVNWTLPDINEISINGTDASKIFQDFSDHSNDSLITNPRFNNVKLLVDYVYLDTDERRRFAQVSHEYLIEQLQFQSP